MLLNPDVPSSSQTPGTDLYISTAPTSTGTPAPKNLFLLATGVLQGSAITGQPYNLTAGTVAPNDIEQYSNVELVAQLFNRRSPLANRFRSAIQEVPFGINIFAGGIAEPANSGFAGFATKLITVAGTAVGSGQISLRICGHEARPSIANGDSAATFASTAKTALDNTIPNCPMVTTGLIGSTIPLIYIVRGEDGNDSPVVVTVPPEITGITFSPGIITVTVNSAGAAGGASLFTIRVGSLSVVVSIPLGSTPAQAATLIAAAVNAATFPLTASVSAGVVTLFYRSGWVVNRIQLNSTEDAMGQVCTISDRHDGGLPLITVSGAAATGTTLNVISGGVTQPVVITATNTLAQSATAIQAAIHGNTAFPLDSAASVGATVPCTWRITPTSASLSGTDTTQRFALTFPASITSAATVPGSATFTALAGAGDPNLTTLLANKAKLDAFSEWAMDYVDTTSINAVSAHIELYANGFYQQGQRWCVADTRGVELVKTDITTATPDLGNYWRPSVICYQDPPCQGGAYSAQIAARLCATDLPYNMDGQILAIGGGSPMLPARSDTEMSATTIDVALSPYHLTPLRGINGNVTIVRGKSTWNGLESKWGDWSYGRMFDALRYGLRNFLNQRFAGKVFFVGQGVIRVSNAFRLIDVFNAIGEYLDSQQGIIVDGSAALKPFIAVGVDENDATRILINLRERPPRENHQRVGVITSAP